ncbi:MAG: 4-alpha-glucanotransferase [Deltaproteobacteria bacterium]|nr:4-alpha-glucanotransferase [Deltaproteobacteria bacterium]
MFKKRSSGVLSHISSLPSPFGIGDIGPSSWQFIDFLVLCDQSCWQFLPTNPTNSFFDDSPYMSISAFAGSPLLISPDLLLAEGLISETTLRDHPDFSPYTTDFPAVRKYKTGLLEKAYLNFHSDSAPGYRSFLKKKEYWLDDYTSFMTLREKYGDSEWRKWPATKWKKEALLQFLADNRDRVNYYRFEQYIFFSQWDLLQKHARKNNIALFGDLPIYVAFDSADVWAHRDIFSLNRKTFKPARVSGVPPDYFSKTGQRWGNPLYRWNHKDQTVQNNLLSWWTQRLSSLFELVDIARIDHFRAFESYWAIPEEKKTAVEGEWLKGPGIKFFESISAELGTLNIVAEDLGIITPAVEQLRDDLHFPGMKVLQFGFDGNPDNSHLPHNFTSPYSVTYTGTHDNDTTLGWYLSDQLDDSLRRTIKKTVNRDLHDSSRIHRDLIYLAQSSISMLTIIPLQDILGFGSDCRMNTPGVAEGNWKWRCSRKFLTSDIAETLKSSTRLFGRGRKVQAKTNY